MVHSESSCIRYDIMHSSSFKRIKVCLIFPNISSCLPVPVVTGTSWPQATQNHLQQCKCQWQRRPKQQPQQVFIIPTSMWTRKITIPKMGERPRPDGQRPPQQPQGQQQQIHIRILILYWSDLILPPIYLSRINYLLKKLNKLIYKTQILLLFCILQGSYIQHYAKNIPSLGQYRITNIPYYLQKEIAWKVRKYKMTNSNFNFLSLEIKVAFF